MTSLWIDEGVEDICIVRMDEKGRVRGKVLLVAYRIKTRSQEILYYGLVLIVSTHAVKEYFRRSSNSSRLFPVRNLAVAAGWLAVVGPTLLATV